MLNLILNSGLRATHDLLISGEKNKDKSNMNVTPPLPPLILRGGEKRRRENFKKLKKN
jgi:hypothetical protein